MKISSISKAAIALGINALVLGGLVAGPASADPAAGVFGDLVGTGSDTIQDVDNGLSAALGTNPDTGNLYIGSWFGSRRLRVGRHHYDSGRRCRLHPTQRFG
jgi:hypothetical protein